MRKLLSLLALFLVLSSCAWFRKERPTVDPSQVEKPLVNLFNGENLDGWTVMGDAAGWQIVDGVIRSEGGKNGNWLRSASTYSNFSLRLEFRISPGGNSGVFIRCAEQGNPWETGYECQISNEQPPRDDLHCTGSLYGYVPANPRPDESPEVWHTYEILCRNTRIMIFVDGHKTVDVVQDKVEAIKDKPLTGSIGLQDSHTAEGYWVEYRNIQLREL